MDKRYGKIIDMPHHKSATHKPMTLYNRAAQFSPFAALTGYESVIMDAEKNYEVDLENASVHGEMED